MLAIAGRFSKFSEVEVFSFFPRLCSVLLAADFLNAALSSLIERSSK